MTGAAVATRLHRIEVHATPAGEEFPPLSWRLWVEGNEQHSAVIGYLGCSSNEGYGQAQIVAFVVDKPFTLLSDEDGSRQQFLEWARRNITEIMYDTARRAIQAQAAQMDFVFTLPLEAPDAELQLREATA